MLQCTKSVLTEGILVFHSPTTLAGFVLPAQLLKSREMVHTLLKTPKENLRCLLGFRHLGQTGDFVPSS